LRVLIRICRDAGIQPVLITQPALYGAGRDPVTGVDLELVEVRRDQNGTMAWRILDLYNDVTRPVADEADCPLIDLAHELPKSSEYFYDYHHFTNAGAGAVAEVVANGLSTSLKHPDPSAYSALPMTSSSERHGVPVPHVAPPKMTLATPVTGAGSA